MCSCFLRFIIFLIFIPVEPMEHIDMKPCTPVVFDNEKMSTIQEGAIQDGTIRYVIMPSTSATNIQDIIDGNK